MKNPAVSDDDGGQDPNEDLPIRVVADDLLPFVPAGRHVPQRTFEVETAGSSHQSSVAQNAALTPKTMTPKTDLGLLHAPPAAGPATLDTIRNTQP